MYSFVFFETIDLIEKAMYVFVNEIVDSLVNSFILN